MFRDDQTTLFNRHTTCTLGVDSYRYVNISGAHSGEGEGIRRTFTKSDRDGCARLSFLCLPALAIFAVAAKCLNVRSSNMQYCRFPTVHHGYKQVEVA